MRKCIDEGTLQAWFDGELDANVARKVAAHLHSCMPCDEAARTLESENLILSQGLSAELVEAVPTERLRQHIKAATTSESQFATRPNANDSWVNSARNWFPSFRVLAYASIAAAILIAGVLFAGKFRKEKPEASVEKVLPQEIPAPKPQTTPGTPETIATPPRQVVAKGQSRTPKPLRQKPSETRRTSEPDALSLAWQETQYRRALAQLDEAIKAQPPFRPSLRVEYEYNLAMIDNAIIAARKVAWKNPKDSLAAQSMLAAYQSKVDLMNLAQARLSEE